MVQGRQTAEVPKKNLRTFAWDFFLEKQESARHKVKSARHIKGKMPRLPRIYLKNAVYYITCRGEHGENIFKDEKDYEMFLELLKKYQEQYEIKVFSYALLPDHLHLLVEMEKEAREEAPNKSQEISDFMHILNNTYTKYFNSRYDKKGHLFRERFKAVLVEKDTYLLKMTAYIHLNPEKLNLVKDSRGYPYTSYPAYLDNNYEQEKWLHIKKGVEEVLRLLQNKDYVDFVREMTDEERAFIQKKLQRGGILGSEDFSRNVKEHVQAYHEDEKAKETRKNYRLYFATATYLIVLIIGLGGIYFYFTSKKLKDSKEKQQVVAQAIQRAEDLKGTEWEIKLVPASGGKEAADMLSFSAGKFASAKLNPSGYSLSNYSVTVEDSGKVAWETMQTSSEGTASWRGEIEGGKMKGILSLREDGKAPQDFSFMSIGYRRK
jgi:REP element-mobilizing transposase RayT